LKLILLPWIDRRQRRPLVSGRGLKLRVAGGVDYRQKSPARERAWIETCIAASAAATATVARS